MLDPCTPSRRQVKRHPTGARTNGYFSEQLVDAVASRASVSRLLVRRSFGAVVERGVLPDRQQPALPASSPQRRDWSRTTIALAADIGLVGSSTGPARQKIADLLRSASPNAVA